MSDAFWIKLLDQLPAIITAAGAIFIAVGTSVAAYFSYRAKIKLDVVEQSVNGHTDKLIRVEKAVSRAEGKAEGVKQEKADREAC